MFTRCAELTIRSRIDLDTTAPEVDRRTRTTVMRPVGHRRFGARAPDELRPLMPIAALAAICDASIPTLNAQGALGGSFSMPTVSAAALQLGDIHELIPGLPALEVALPAATYLHHLRGFLRTAFFVEPVVLPAAKTTRFRTRWQLDADDPRYADPETCLDVARGLIGLVTPFTTDETGREILRVIARHPMTPYELPVSYAGRSNPIHRRENFVAIDGDVLRHVTGCRLLLLAAGTPNLPLLKAAYTKIRVKTYLTDRALTGAHKTNREKRWEAHPDSVQFALRTSCMQIERVLVNQLCHFEAFPADVRPLLQDAELLFDMPTPARCPVTLLPMSLTEFAEAAADPEHGRSPFQVGHLDPLKLEGNTWTNGHRPENISWISEHGNRIQGSLSLAETRSMLQRIWTAYVEAGILDH